MRVLVVDDHRLLVEGLVNLLVAHGHEVVGTAADGDEALARAVRLRPDLVLMDLRMPGRDGLSATRLITARLPEIKVVVLTTSADEDDLFEAVRSGACGYLLKSTSGEEFAASLAGLAQGVPPFSPGLATKVLQEFARQAGAAARATAETETSEGLTERQTEVLRAVAGGLTYKEVGSKLALSERTVRYHMAEIMARLHLEHRSQVLAYAGRAGLTGEEPPPGQ
ncbi:MAG: response regulator transcription factor [Chloroflexota bacterium]